MMNVEDEKSHPESPNSLVKKNLKRRRESDVTNHEKEIVAEPQHSPKLPSSSIHNNSSSNESPPSESVAVASRRNECAMAGSDLRRPTLPVARSANSLSRTHHSYGSQATTTTTTVYIGNIPNPYCTESVVERIMSVHGTVVRCTMNHGNSGRSTSFAFCEFLTPLQAETAIRAVHGRRLGGYALVVRPAHDNKNNRSTLSQYASSTPGTAAGSGAGAVPKKRLQQQVDSKIDAIKRKLASKAGTASTR